MLYKIVKMTGKYILFEKYEHFYNRKQLYLFESFNKFKIDHN